MEILQRHIDIHRGRERYRETKTDAETYRKRDTEIHRYTQRHVETHTDAHRPLLRGWEKSKCPTENLGPWAEGLTLAPSLAVLGMRESPQCSVGQECACPQETDYYPKS